MKKIYLFICTVMWATACSENPHVTVTVTNPTSMHREKEMVEVSMKEVSDKLQLSADENVVVKDLEGNEVPYQITFDDMLIFPVNVPANGNSMYLIQQGNPILVPAIACGRQYPERKDDIAWENDLAAYRTYGPALQESGERAFGYDIWTKRNTTEPVVEERYALELSPEREAKLDSLRKNDPQAAEEYSRATSYHVDHGYGMDSYKVGPTLGGGTAALMINNEIVYPWAYKDFEILDNGPLRFKVKLVYNPLTVGEDTNVVETRIISLDAGWHLNKTVVSFSGLSNITDIVTGIVLHDDAPVTADAVNGYITYVDPTEAPQDDNGNIFVGAAFPAKLKEAKVLPFLEKEKYEQRGGAEGHVVGISDYVPGTEYVYYWGSAWSKAGMTPDKWNEYVAEYAAKARNPLSVSMD